MVRFWIITAGSIFYASSLAGLPGVAQDPIPCVLDLETHFFDERIVNQGLSLYNIRQEQWLLINHLLQVKSSSVPERMKRRTAFMVPNPLEYPMNKGLTAQILKEVLFEVLLETLREYHAAGRPHADSIFEYIFNERFPDFLKCFGEEARKLGPSIEQ